MEMDEDAIGALEQSLPDHILYWLKEAAPDCHFVVGLGPEHTQRIGAVKIFLMGHSEPFRRMLNDSMLAEEGDISLEDVYPDAFWNFLICVYGGSDILLAQLDFGGCARLLYIADKYLANFIKTKVSSRLQELFSADNIFLALSHPICYDGSLKKEVLHCLQREFNNITVDERFLELDGLVMKWISEQEPFNVKEVDIWNSLVRWAKHQTGSTDGEMLRSQMFHLLSNIRFLAMKCQEFCTHVVLSGVLRENEVHEIAKSFGSGEPHNLDHICKKKNDRLNQPAGPEMGRAVRGSAIYLVPYPRVNRRF